MNYSKSQVNAENLKPGEHYAGIILGDRDYRLILLPGEAENVTWEGAQDFAGKLGGDLPTRREQALLYANLKREFKPNWYWSGEQHAALDDCAWVQDFGDGTQGFSTKSAEIRARAVRRIYIEEGGGA